MTPSEGRPEANLSSTLRSPRFTFALGSGFAFLEDMFAQHLVHKTVLSTLGWLVFGALLLGRLRYGWRGRTAILWTLSGFIILVLAYFGSKAVLELILQR